MGSQRSARRKIAGPRVEMRKRYLLDEHITGVPESIPHITKQEQFGGRDAVRVRSYTALANINVSIREKLTQMIVGPSVAEPQLQYVPLEVLNESGSEIETGPLGLQPADKTVEPTHRRSGGNMRVGVQSFDLGTRAAELPVCRLEPLRQLLHDRDRHIREFSHHAHKRLL